jgi:transcription elongation factor Elf1
LSGEKTLQPSNEAMERQTEYDKASKTYTARCGVCGKAKSLKKGLFQSLFSAIQKLRLKFNFCDTCGKWVCEDCFLIDDGNGNGIGICTVCAKKHGITGLTGAQFEEAWPRIQSSLVARFRAAKRAIGRE